MTASHDQANGEEQPSISHERFIRRVLRIRKSIDKQSPKPFWQVIVESAGGAALITVVMGGIIGGIITARYQAGQAELARERAGQQQMEQLRFEATKKSFDLVFESVAAAEDVINLASKAMADAPREQRREIRQAYNHADVAWRKQRLLMGMTLAYYSKNYKDAAAAWDAVAKDVTAYMQCSEAWVNQHSYYQDGQPTGCENERNKTDGTIKALQALVLGPK
jgi:hypothetical protein